MNAKVAFAFNSYYQGRIELGPTSSWEVQWAKSLRLHFQSRVHFFNPDTFGADSSDESDLALLELLDKNECNTLVMIYHNGLQWRRQFIGAGALTEIRRRGIRIVAIWGDLQIREQRQLAYSLKNWVQLNVCTASEAIAARVSKNLPVYYSWVPVTDELVLKDSKCGCDALVSYAGSPKGARLAVIRYLEKSGIEVHVGGGEGVGSLPRDEYLRLLAHPISLSFSKQRGSVVTNARSFEILNQGALLLEEWGRETAKWFKPFEEYIPWDSKADLLKAVRTLKEDTFALERVSKAGKLAVDQLTNGRLWTEILEEVSMVAWAASTPKRFERMLPDISHLSVGRRSREKLCNGISSSNKFAALFVVTEKVYKFRDALLVGSKYFARSKLLLSRKTK